MKKLKTFITLMLCLAFIISTIPTDTSYETMPLHHYDYDLRKT